VIQISLPYIYDFYNAMRPLDQLKVEDSINTHYWTLYTAEQMLNAFLTQSVYSQGLKATSAPGMELLAAIKKLTTENDKERKLDFFDVYSLQNALKEFEIVLRSELNVGNAYLVTKKRGYDTSDLINRGELLFPSELIVKVPASLRDVREVGRCLAFELSTAAGFHMMRAFELVLREYFDIVSSGAERPKTNNIGDYLRVMDDEKFGDVKVRECLRQITKLHRNELIHPENSLTLDEAIGLLGIAQSAMEAMLREIPPPSTGELAKLMA
jgi:hypothetical protein